ncbi:MAG: carboxymuconolactone decarboxylase family protein [Bryobacterales bacterium]|nr:carboxymuconolactone decarboxylase family protein [Bryobacterales bacterium]
MTRIQPIDPAAAPARTRELLEGVRKALGMTPNMMKTMARSPAVLEGYLALNRALSEGLLDPGFRERIALAVAEYNACGYCLSAHAVLGKAAGLTDAEVDAARRGAAAAGKVEAGLQFAQELVRRRGGVSDEALARVRGAGCSDAEIAEIVAHVALNVFTNYLNLVARTEVDFPVVVPARAA